MCPPCTYTINVKDCKTCDCGKWDNSGIKIQKDGTIISNVKCDGDVSLGIGTYGIQFSNFICSPSNDKCSATYLWTVQGPNSGNGTGNIINFNFSQAGTYIVTLTPFCGDKRCEPCKIVIKIEDPLPCSLSFLDNLKDNYCVGDQVTINWTGTAQPSTVNLVLIDFTNWIVYQVIATSIPNSGSYTWTLPADLPCDPERKWCFYITDPAQSTQCWNYSKEFTIGCCNVKPCDCGTWSKLTVQTAAGAKRYDCGSTIEWTCKQALNFSASYQCSPNDKTCEATTTWNIKKGTDIIKSGTGTNQLNDGFSLLENGTYTLTLNASCNGKVCPPCTYTIIVSDCIDKPCDCGKWNNSGIKIQKDGAIISNLKCDGDASLGIGTYGIQFSNFICSPSNDNCFSTYLWTVQGPVSGNGAGNIINFNFSQAGIYTVTLTPFCGGKRCNPCKIVIKIEDPLPCSLGFLDNLKDNYCVGDQVTINWTGTPNPSTVNLVLIDFTNWTVFQTIAANIPNSGTYTWTLPTNLPCDPERKWCFYVTDPAQNPQCWNYSKEFTIGCCVDEKPCDCGTWSTLLINGVKFKCGNETPIKLRCNKPVAFSNSYQCSPNDKTCQAETKWEVTKDGSSFSSGNGSSGTFTPTSNGTYTLTTYSNCNGKECKPCITTFIVEDCIDEKPCDCGEWSDFPIKVQTGGAIISRIKCNGSSSLGIGAYSIQYPNFICNPNDKTCLASYSWSVQGPVTGNGTGNLINFNFSLAGTYTITLTPICGNKKCKPCKIVIRIEDPLPCNLSFTDNLKDNYCVGNQVTINWTGTPQPSTVNLVLIDFTNWVVYQTLATNIPNSGSYTLTLPPNLPCDPERKWCFYVTDPAQIPQCWNYSKEFTIGCCVDKPCDCGTWSPLSVQNAAGTRRYDCGSTIEWTCKQALNFTSNYQCSPNDKTCEAKTTWKLEKAGVIVKSGTGTNQLNDGFSLLENGTYNLTLNASCNGKICLPCTYVIVVKDCADDKGLYNGTSIYKNKYADDFTQINTRVNTRESPIKYDVAGKIQLLSPRNGEKLKTDNPIFSWKNSKVTNDREKYRLRIVEIKGDESPEQAMQRIDSFFDIFIESDLKATNGKNLFYQYPASAPKFKPENKYAWTILINGSYYAISIFDRWGEL